MARYLSRAWLQDLARTAADIDVPPPVDGAPNRLVLGQAVTGTPEGDVRYVVRLDGRALAVEPVDAGSLDDADVVFEVDWATAEAMAQGRLGAQDAFTAGRLQVKGDVSLLLRHSSVLVALDGAFAAVRDRTEWSAGPS